MNTQPMQLEVGGRQLHWTLALPPKPADHPRLLLTFYDTAENALHLEDQNLSALTFLAAGHVVAAFDLPHHGGRATRQPPDGLVAMRDAYLAGDDPFRTFIEDASAIIDFARDQNLADVSRVAASGVSRSGYGVLRLAAVDDRVTAVGAFAPVTDWRVLEIYAGFRDDPRVAELAIDNYAEALAERDIYLSIGAHDLRVGTAACAAFAAEVLRVQAEQADAAGRDYPPGILAFHVDPDSPGHTMQSSYRQAGAEFLLASVTGLRHSTQPAAPGCPQ